MNGRIVHHVWALVRREYVQRVKNKWFLITTLGLPLLIVGLSFLSGYLVTAGVGDAPVSVGVVDRVGLADVDLPTLVARADSSVAVELLPSGAPGDGLAARLRTSSHDALLLVDETVLAGEDVRLITRTGISERRLRALREELRQAAVQTSLRRAGLDPEGARAVFESSRIGIDVERIDREGTRSQEIASALALVLTFVLYMMFIIYGQMITRGVLEEKTSDIAEILVSSVRPWELMLGKILGIGAMGLTQIAIWGVTLAGVAAYGLAGSAVALSELGVDLSAISLPLVRLGLAFLAFFVLGYFLYASVFAAVGAMVGDQDDVQQVSFFPMLLIILPFFLAFSAAQAGTADSTLMVAASYFPFFTPILMLVRMTMGAAAGWEVLGSIVILLASIAGVAWLAGRIYRVGILMKGKRPDLPEVARWIRYG